MLADDRYVAEQLGREIGREMQRQAVEVWLEAEAAAAWAAVMEAEARATRAEVRSAYLEVRLEGGGEGGGEGAGGDGGGEGGGEAVTKGLQRRLAWEEVTPAGASSSQCLLPTGSGATPTACRVRGGSLEGSRRSPAVSPPLPPPPPPLASAPTEPPSTSTATPSTTHQHVLTPVAFTPLDATPASSAPPSTPPGHRPSVVPTTSIHPIAPPAKSEARLVSVATPRSSHDTPPALAACQGGLVLGERASALLARRSAASHVAAAAIALAAVAARTPLLARAAPPEVGTSETAAAAMSASVTGQPLHLPKDLLVAAVTSPAALLVARAAAAAPRSAAEATHTAAVLRCAKLLEGARGGEAAGARGCEATLGRRDGRASGRPDPWIQRSGHPTTTAAALASGTATATAGRRGRDGWSHPRDSMPGAAWSTQRAQVPRAARAVRSGHSFFPYNHGPGRLRGEAAPLMPPRLKPGSATSATSATPATSAGGAAAAKQPHELEHPNSATRPDEAGRAAQRVAELPPPQPLRSPATQPCLTRLAHPLGDYEYARTGKAKGKCRPGSPLPYRWPRRPMSPPVE